MNISAPFIHRPVATTLLALGLLMCGVVAYRLLPVAAIPKVEFPTINVSAALPGASPTTVASSLATPLERHLGQIAGVTEMTSVSTVGGCNVTLQFDLDRKIDAAAQDVQAAINAAANDLPSFLPSPPSYRKVNPSDVPVVILALTSETLSQADVFEYADSILGQKLSQIEGISQVTITGATRAAVRVQMNPRALAASNLSLEDVRSALSQANVNLPVGTVEGDAVTQTLTINGQLNEAKPYQQLIVTQRGKIPVQLSAFGRAIDDVENNRIGGWSGNRPAVLVIVSKQPDANVLDTVARIRDALPRLKHWMPPATHLEILADRTATIRGSVNDVKFSLAISIALVMLVVLLFLRRLAPTLIASVTIPLALAGTVAGMYLLDYTIDNLSLMALTISVGFVVDDAIVVIENIQRFIERGESVLSATLQGSRQIGFTVVSMTLSLVAVFIPLFFMGGLVGRLFHEFAVTVGLAVILSGVISLTVTPMLCRQYLKAAETPIESGLSRRIEGIYQWILARYLHALDLALRYRRLTLMGAVMTVGLTVWLYHAVPKGFFPQQDTGLLMATSEAAQDISFAAMTRLQQQVSDVVLSDPAVATVASFIGAVSGGTSVNNGRVFVVLKPLAERKISADAVIARLRHPLAKVAGINLFLQSVQELRAGGRSSKAQFQYALQASDLTELATWSARLVTRLRTMPALVDVNSDQQPRGLETQVVIDRDTAARMGVTISAIDNTLYDAFGQRQVSTIYTDYNQHHVILEAAPSFQRDPVSLQSIYVRATGGQQVPLSSVAHYETTNASLSVNHQGQFPAITISFNLAPGVPLGQATEILQRATDELHLPSTVHGAFQGTAKAFASALSSLPVLIVSALLVVYLVLGILYESLIQPLTILSTLPSAGLGALLALMLTGNDLSLVSFIGIILLMGIVKKNAIMMIDFALEAQRARGMTPFDAIRAACEIRFRPIMMTTFAALLGALPLAIGFGIGAELRRPLGISIIGGLVVSQILTLFTTPVIYLSFANLRRDRGRVSRPNTLTLLLDRAK